MTYVGVSKEWLKTHAVEFLSNIDTSELVEELCKREGVRILTVDSGEPYCIASKEYHCVFGSGAARILVVRE